MTLSTQRAREMDMACTHTADCPLFPKLNASLGAWRTHYCDTDVAWRNCARFERSMRGEAVPLALLPNGKLVGVLTEDYVEHHQHPQQPGGGVTTVVAPAPAAAATETDEPPTVIKRSLWQRLFGKGH